MDIQPVKMKADYQAALKEIETLMDAKPHTSQGYRLEVLIALVEPDVAPSDLALLLDMGTK